MKFLLIEDETDFCTKVKAAAEDHGVKCVLSSEVNLHQQWNTDSALEDQLKVALKSVIETNDIDLVLLDTDLSRIRTGLSQSNCRAALQELGIPVCRYKKAHSRTPLTALNEIHSVSKEGTTAIQVPHDLLNDDLTGLIIWLEDVSNGFAALMGALSTDSDLMKNQLGPAGILQKVCDKPSLGSDLLGYTGNNLFFFGGLDVAEEANNSALAVRRLSTQLGYWLLNYVLFFPGPILNKTAAAAYLNLTKVSMDRPELIEFLSSALYSGPFSKANGPYYWREDLSNMLSAVDEDIATSEPLKSLNLERVDKERVYTSAYYCLLTKDVILEKDAASNPEWIPSGASVARIRADELEKLGPMLNI